MPIAILFSLGVAAIMYRNEVAKVWPEAGTAYSQLGFKVNRFGLDFEDIERSRTVNDTIPVVTVAGKALNISRSTVDTPAVQVDLKDERGVIVATTYGRIRPDALAPGEAGTFRIVVTTGCGQSQIEGLGSGHGREEKRGERWLSRWMG